MRDRHASGEGNDGIRQGMTAQRLREDETEETAVKPLNVAVIGTTDPLRQQPKAKAGMK